MPLRIATFNAENLMQRFDFSGFRNDQRKDRTLQMIDVKDERHFQRLEEARVVAHSDDSMQLTALAIAETMADIVCLQEVENIQTLNSFEYGYMFKMVGRGYRQKFLVEGNDGRGIDVAVMAREETFDGQKIEFVKIKSHAQLTYDKAGLHTPQLKAMGEEAHEKIFRRGCLEIDFKIGGKPITLFVVHFKSMGPGKNGVPGREYTMPVREAEAKAVRQIINNKFNGKSANKRWLICGDMNDYRSRILVSGGINTKRGFKWVREKTSAVDQLLKDDFSVSLAERRDKNDQWTLYHTRGPQEQHLCQLDYILASPSVASLNVNAVPQIIRSGQPYRTPFPDGQDVDRYPRVGWDRPKSSDHCPVVVSLNMV
ncbi:MAG: endonuclease/exonuclease/phosphatase family protein [Rhizobiaceae bacterium]|nr:endonuclease/exonuclease/phosphatase family protein [Rhizobiaceae bacterium]